MFQLEVDLCYSEATVLYGMPDYKDASTLAEVNQSINLYLLKFAIK